MSGKSNMQFRLSLNGENIDLPKIEKALQIRLNGSCIDAPKNCRQIVTARSFMSRSHEKARLKALYLL